MSQRPTVSLVPEPKPIIATNFSPTPSWFFWNFFSRFFSYLSVVKEKRFILRVTNASQLYQPSFPTNSQT
ncbi:hypothetical protein QUA86_27580, partial [Microcoleus sp. F6_B6]